MEHHPNYALLILGAVGTIFWHIAIFVFVIYTVVISIRTIIALFQCVKTTRVNFPVRLDDDIIEYQRSHGDLIRN